MVTSKISEPAGFRLIQKSVPVLGKPLNRVVRSSYVR